MEFLSFNRIDSPLSNKMKLLSSNSVVSPLSDNKYLLSCKRKDSTSEWQRSFFHEWVSLKVVYHMVLIFSNGSRAPVTKFGQILSTVAKNFNSTFGKSKCWLITFPTLNYECLWKYFDLSSITIEFQLWRPEASKNLHPKCQMQTLCLFCTDFYMAGLQE